jgi:hypothetical protein
MRAENSVNVIRGMDGGWVVRKYRARRALRRFATQQQAIEWGRALSEKRATDFVIHRADGSIQEWVSRTENHSPFSDPQPISP